MSGRFFLDWAILAVSLFNTVLLLWLALTVLLNSDRRGWGIWLAGGGLLLGGGLFVVHSAVLGLGLDHLGRSPGLWLFAGSAPAIMLPFAWYLIMLWYAGYWDDARSALHRRQWPWLHLTLALLALGLVGLIILADPVPQLTPLKWRLMTTLAIGVIPLPVIVYPVYVFLCLSLSLDALRRPGPTGRVMGPLARQRARPWLVAASVTLLLVSLLIAWVVVWIIASVRQRPAAEFYGQFGPQLAWFDLGIGGLIALAILLLGQAVVSYEVFTGKTLPRRGLLWHWRWAVALAAGYSLVVGESMATQLRPIYSLLLATMLMTFAFALISWRSYAHREQAIAQLRPFVTSQRLYEHLLTRATAPAEVDVTTPFYALCQTVLDARLAHLVAVGPLAPLVGPPLSYPPERAAGLPPLAGLAARFTSPDLLWAPLDPAQHGEAHWAVPLWSERGLIGLLLLGEKRDGSLYTQEEIEIARASGERLIDAQASAEMARRLMGLQRERLVESQVVDRQTRRVLHDDVLPLLHAATLALNQQQNGGPAEAVALLTAAHRKIADLLREMPATAATEVGRLGLVGALRRTVAKELSAAFEHVEWQVDPEAARQSAAVPPLTAEVVYYAAREALRNAARYGRGEGDDRALHLRISLACHRELELIIEDNGVGLDRAAAHGGGSGQGLALHSTMMAVIGGSLVTESVPGAYTRVRLLLPRRDG